MVENTEMKSKKATPVIIVLILIILGLGGYIIYDKFISSSSSDNQKKLEEQEKPNKEQENILPAGTKWKAESGQELITGFGSVKIYPNGDVYLLSDDTFDNKISALGNKETIWFYPDADHSICDGYDDTSSITCAAVEAYKLNVKNIVSAYDSNIGQDICRIIALINDNGDLYVLLYWPEEKETDNVRISSFVKYPLDNVVSILENAGDISADPIAIDKDGNRYRINLSLIE